MTRPARAVIDAQALKHNLARVRSYAPRAKVMAVVKANAYGHGLAWAAHTLADADAFGVASIDEALQLRQAGIAHPICLLEGFFHADELSLIASHRFEPTIHHDLQLQALEQSAIKPITVWLKIDTGMHRIGFAPVAAADALTRLQRCRAVRDVRLLTHFANADNGTDAATPAQIERFRSFSHGRALEVSLANSAGIVGWPDSHGDWVRPGIMLYGVSPMIGRPAADFDLRPVMTLQTALISVHNQRKGEPIGYAGTWRCPEDMPVGVAALGYGDGYPRHAPSGTPVLVNGARVPLIGRVSMDMVTLDLRTQPAARVGDPVVLWGNGLPIEEVAQRADTIGYELLCHVTARVPRIELIDG
jgi:alanine racemase